MEHCKRPNCSLFFQGHYLRFLSHFLRYPPDAPLEYKNLPRDAQLDTDPGLDDKEIDHMFGLEMSKNSLSLLKGDGKDFLDWIITGQEKACEALNDPCDLKQLACEGLQETLTDLEDLACSPFAIVVPTFGQATFGAYYACIVKKKASKIAKRAKCLVALNTCRVKALTCKLSVQLQKKILHAVHVGVKIA